MNRHLLYILPLCVLAFSTCKKNPLPPEDSSGDPVFYVKASVNGVSIPDMEAGKNDYYMNSGYYQDANNVYVYKGELKQNGTPTGYSIAFLINDYKVSQSGASMKPDSGLYAGNYEFNDGNVHPAGYTATFAAVYPTVASFDWTLSTGNYNDQVISTYFKNGSKQNVKLKVIMDPFEPVVLSNDYKIGNPLQVNLLSYYDQAAVSFTAAASKPVDQHFWNFGDGNVSSWTQSPTATHTYTAPDRYIASVTSVSGSDTCVSKAFVNTTSINLHANFTASFTPVPNTKKLSTIAIQLTDNSTGKVYSSESFDQPTTSNFQILSVENYMSNSGGEPTKKLKIKFNCTVKSGNDPLTINGEAVIAVAYKP